MCRRKTTLIDWEWETFRYGGAPVSTAERVLPQNDYWKELSKAKRTRWRKPIYSGGPREIWMRKLAKWDRSRGRA